MNCRNKNNIHLLNKLKKFNYRNNYERDYLTNDVMEITEARRRRRNFLNKDPSKFIFNNWISSF